MAKKDFKKVNHNVFAEKLIHRFLLETYYRTSSVDKDSYKLHLPEKYQEKVVNVILPETSKKDTRPDLEIYFKGESKAIPVEVKFDIGDAKNSPNQIKHIHKNSGFYVSFTELEDGFENKENTTETFTPDVKSKLLECDRVVIDKLSFNNWFSKQYPTLLNNQSIGYDSSSVNQWIVVQRAWKSKRESTQNWFKMIKKSGNKNRGFWAFEQKTTGKAVSNCLNMRQGDMILFIFVKAQSSQIARNPSNITHVEKAYSCKLTSDYFLDKKRYYKGVFEKKDVDLHNSKWPHFIEFEFLQETELGLEFSPPKHLDSTFADSYNQGVKPIPISRQDFREISGLVGMVPFDKIH